MDENTNAAERAREHADKSVERLAAKGGAVRALQEANAHATLAVYWQLVANGK